MTQSDLGAYLRAAEARPFRYGRHDCVLFASGWVHAATGRDVLSAWSYRSAKEGEALLAARGLPGLAAAVDTVLERRPILWARRGDIVMVRGGLAIVTGAEAVGLRRPAGLETVSLAEADIAWRVE